MDQPQIWQLCHVQVDCTKWGEYAQPGTSSMGDVGTTKSTSRSYACRAGKGTNEESICRRRRSSVGRTTNTRLITRNVSEPVGIPTISLKTALSGVAMTPRVTIAIARVAAPSLSKTEKSTRTG